MNDTVDWLMEREQNKENQEWNILILCSHSESYKNRNYIVELQVHRRLACERNINHLMCSRLGNLSNHYFSAWNIRKTKLN